MVVTVRVGKRVRQVVHQEVSLVEYHQVDPWTAGGSPKLNVVDSVTSFMSPFTSSPGAGT